MLLAASQRAAARHAGQALRQFSSSPSPAADYTHIIIGAGVVGLATARALASRPGATTLVLERNAAPGTETSSRNSEVIHAGLYYPADSLKTRLCLRGKAQLYALCAAAGIPHAKLGKWVVAQDAGQLAQLQAVAAHAASLDVPVRWVPEAERAERLRAEGVRAAAGALESPGTGIVDSHALMGFLEEEARAKGADVAVGARVVAVERAAGGGFEVRVRMADSGDESVVRSDTVVNAAGLGAVAVSNMLLPEHRRVAAYFAKGTYFSYSGQAPRPTTLVYPAPQPGAAGLGTHLTLDLAGRVRFGPDVEWVESPDAEGAYAPSEHRLAGALDAIAEYLPGIQKDKIRVDYCGIRPKLGKKGAVGSGQGFQDFVIREEEGFLGFVNLLGIESPGLTSSLAIAEEVEGILYR